VAISILMDIIQLGIYFPDNQSENGGGNSELLILCVLAKQLLTHQIY